MQRKVVLTLALILGLASYAQAALSIVVGQHNYSPGTGMVVIPITVTGSNAVHGTDLSVQLGGTSSAVAPFGMAPPITYQGSEQYNQPTPGAGSPVLSPSMWDQHANTWGDSTDGLNDGVPTIPGSAGYGTAGMEGTWFTGSLTFNSTTVSTGQIVPGTGNSGIEVNLVVDLTGFGPGTWPLMLLAGKAGATDFVDRTAATVPVSITDGSITIVPEPTSIVLGLFAAVGLGLVAIRKRRARRA